MFLKIIAPIALILGLPLSISALAEPSPARPTAPMPGGWSEVAANTAELRAVAKFVVPRLPRKKPRLLKIEGGERQVVAGTNYRIVLQLTDRSRWRALVWHKLDGSYALTRFERIK